MDSKPSIAYWYIKIFSQCLRSTFVQKLFGKDLVLNVFKTFFFLLIIFEIGFAVFPPFNINSFRFGSLIIIGTPLYSFVYHKYTSWIKKKDDPNYGLKLQAEGQTFAILNIKWINHYPFMFYWFSFFFLYNLIMLPFNIADRNFMYIFSCLAYAVEVFVLIPLANYLYVNNPKSSVYSDVKNKVHSTVEKTKEALAAKPQPIPVRV